MVAFIAMIITYIIAGIIGLVLLVKGGKMLWAKYFSKDGYRPATMDGPTM